MTKPVINIYRTLDEALYFKNSPLNRFYRFNGVHLLPNNGVSYTQVTNTPLGINLEDWTVKGVNIRTGVEQDITTSFNVDSITNSENGNPQLYWSLTNVTIDFGVDMIYLKIDQALGETFYTQPFLLTNQGKDWTTQFHYKERVGDSIQSIGMKTWFRQFAEYTDLSTYYELSTQLTVPETIKLSQTEIHVTEQMNIDQIKKLAMVLRSPYLYINSFRAYLYKAVEIPKHKANENFVQIEFEVSVDENATIELQVASKGDWKASDWDSSDWLIYGDTSIKDKTFSNKFSNKFGKNPPASILLGKKFSNKFNNKFK
jgi:hypothetical protein